MTGILCACVVGGGVCGRKDGSLKLVFAEGELAIHCSSMAGFPLARIEGMKPLTNFLTICCLLCRKRTVVGISQRKFSAGKNNLRKIKQDKKIENNKSSRGSFLALLGMEGDLTQRSKENIV